MIGNKETIQNIAVKLTEEQIKSKSYLNGQKDRVIFVLGSKNVGKSILINKFLDRDESAKSTLTLEYSFGRRSVSRQSIQKQLCHIWELGSITGGKELIDIPIQFHDLASLSAVIMLDLSKPKSLWNDIQESVEGLKNSYKKIKLKSDIETNILKMKDKFGLEHIDLPTLDIFPFPVVIIGGKYDLFEKLDPEIKKHICRCIRSVSHLIGGSVLFYSVNNQLMAKQIRDVLNYLGFGTPSKPIKNISIDYNGPLSIFNGSDSWKSIGVFPLNFVTIGINLNNQILQQDNDVIEEVNDPAIDAGFREILIDELCSKKRDEFYKLFQTK